MSELSNKIALVTGASRGIGRASALGLAGEGAQIIVHYNRGCAEAEEVVNEVKSMGGVATVAGADLAAPDGAHRLAELAKGIAGSRLDIIVANASWRLPCARTAARWTTA